MEAHEIEANVVSYTSILDGYARWLESASSKKNSSVTESDVLDAIASAEDTMIRLERSKDGPNVVAYNAPLKVYLNGAKLLGQVQGDAESSSSQLLDLAASASSTFDRMAKAKVYPNFVAYSCAVHVGGGRFHRPSSVQVSFSLMEISSLGCRHSVFRYPCQYGTCLR